jgi:hypothetical protein
MRLEKLAEKYQVPEHLNAASQKLGEVSEKVYDRVTLASEAAKRGAAAAYRAALDNPKTSIAGVVLAAALIGGALWFVFGDWRKVPVQRRRHGTRVRAGSERRRKGRAARPAAA